MRHFQQTAWPEAVSPTSTVGETMPLIDTLDELTRLQRVTPDLFLRISAGPDHDREMGSWDSESGYVLPGLPAWSLQPEPWWAGTPRHWIARQLTQHGYRLSGGHDVRAWLLTGAVVGNGPHNEPLVSHWRPLAWLGRCVIPQADAAYAAWRTRGLQ